MCGTSYPELDPRMFSYNSKHGWCPDCVGTGLKLSREQRLALAGGEGRADLHWNCREPRGPAAYGVYQKNAQQEPRPASEEFRHPHQPLSPP